MAQRARRPVPEKPRPTPPPPDRDSGEPRAVFLDGALIAEEFGGKLGWFLFLAHRSVEVWAMASPGDRRGLFTERSYVERSAELTLLEVDAAMRRPLSVTTEMIGNPARADPYDVATACKALAAWAAGKEKFATARLFAEAAALAVPDDPRTLYAAGKYARQGADYLSAERLLSLAMDMARRKGDWKTFCRALSCTGIMHQRRGNYRVARKHYLICFRVARKRRLKAIAGEAAHDLFTLEAECGDFAAAEEWGGLALEGYAGTHPRLLMLAHDVAFLWFERGEYARALSVFQQLLPHFTHPPERVRILSSISRAASSVGAKAEFDSSSAETLTMVETASAIELAGQTLLDLAHGAVQLKQWDLAEHTARRAFEVAKQRGEGRLQLEAEAVLEAAQRHRVAEYNAVHGQTSDQKLWNLVMQMLKDFENPDAAEG